jgi:excinuclease ABC subunit C
MNAPHPRVYSTNRLSKKSLAEFFGPFPSRAAADRYCDAVLDLFKLRRCYEDLALSRTPRLRLRRDRQVPDAVQRRKPTACTPAEYAAEAQRVFAFFRTRGQSLLDEVAAQRDAASDALDFETAAALHKHWEKVRAAALLADELVRPVTELRAVILQQSVGGPFIAESFPAMSGEQHSVSPDAAVFLLANGHPLRPRAALHARRARRPRADRRRQLALRAAAHARSRPHRRRHCAGSRIRSDPRRPRPRRARQLTALTEIPAPLDELCDTLSLFRRWYYRPEKQRTGEVFLPTPEGSWPIRRILNGAARVVLGPPAEAPPADREAAREAKRHAAGTQTGDWQLETGNS